MQNKLTQAPHFEQEAKSTHVLHAPRADIGSTQTFSTRQLRSIINLDKTLRTRCVTHAGDFTLDVELLVALDGLVTLVGKAGSGKTLFLRSLCGLEKNFGYVHIGNTVCQHDKQCLLPHKRPIGLVSADTPLFYFMSIQNNLEYAFKRGAASAQATFFEDVITFFGLDTLRKKRVHQLTYSQRLTVVLARAVLARPKVLLIDNLFSRVLKHPLSEPKIAPYCELRKKITMLYKRFDIPIIFAEQPNTRTGDLHALLYVRNAAQHIVFLDKGAVSSEISGIAS